MIQQLPILTESLVGLFAYARTDCRARYSAIYWAACWLGSSGKRDRALIFVDAAAPASPEPSALLRFDTRRELDADAPLVIPYLNSPIL